MSNQKGGFGSVEDEEITEREANPEPIAQDNKSLRKESKAQLGPEAVALQKDKTPVNSKDLQTELLGPSPRIATDKWTSDDSLGHNDYAHAIARFLTYKDTGFPLSISIQAAWGGGKTSLMRMVQEKLDIHAPKPTEYGKFLTEAQFVKSVDDLTKVLSHLKDKRNSQQQARRSLKLRSWKLPSFLNYLRNKENNQQEKKLQIKKLRSAEGIPPRVTIWFNAWKYESTQQLWAGMADTIVKQIVLRLEPEQREEFLFQLHLQRQNLDRIRQKIYDQILIRWWEKTRLWILGYVTAIGISIVMSVISSEIVTNYVDQSLKNFIGWGGLGGLILSIAGAAITSFIKYRDVKDEPANIIASEYLDMPDYSTNVGFIHHVEEDLKLIFDTIENTNRDYLPMVIFVDDLDRCSPEKIADVAEGINLFLAGEFDKCIFVLGIDSEIVSAALEVAHNDVISKLPKYSASIPLGRRFMDKFVQLPVTIPLPEKEKIDAYVESLLTDHKEKQKDTAEEKNMRRKRLDQEISNYSDGDPRIRKLIKDATSSFSSNPREMKRFLNAFRFQYFLWLARKNLKLNVPTEEQLTRWIILSLKWPEVVRWLQWYSSSNGSIASQNNEDQNKNNSQGNKEPLHEHAGMKKLEETLGAVVTNEKEWLETVTDKLRLDISNSPWVTDEALQKFFQQEANEKDKDKRLASSRKNGFY